jgi:DUF1707 SHOCT-like domain
VKLAILATMLRHRLYAAAGSMRLSDAERERALRELKAHYAEGRISTAELEARVERVYRSRTRRQTAAYLWDLPLQGLRLLALAKVRRIERALLRVHLLTYATANACLVGMWAVTGQGVFWPAWLLIPSSAVLGWHLFASRRLSRAISRHRW